MKPQYKLEIFTRENGGIGIENVTTCKGWGEPSPHKRYDTFYVFDGQRARVIVFSANEKFTRDYCLQVATRFVDGGYRFVSFDFSTWQESENDGR